MSNRDKRAVNALHALLMDRFPRAFPKDYDALRPLKTGIYADLLQRLPEADPVLLRRVLANHTRRDGYLLALLHQRGDRRYDLDGQPVGTVTAAERAAAARLLEASRQRQQAKAEQLRTHQVREEARRKQRAEEQRRREEKARRKAEHARRLQEAAARKAARGPPAVSRDPRPAPYPATPGAPPAQPRPSVAFKKKRRIIPPTGGGNPD